MAQGTRPAWDHRADFLGRAERSVGRVKAVKNVSGFPASCRSSVMTVWTTGATGFSKASKTTGGDGFGARLIAVALGWAAPVWGLADPTGRQSPTTGTSPLVPNWMPGTGFWA